MINYVAGFYFNEHLTEVVLIKKISKPGTEHVAGKLNGVGGKIERGETPYYAMVREFEEGTGKVVYDWYLFDMHFVEGEYKNHLFCGYGDHWGIRTTTMEEVEAYSITGLDSYQLADHVKGSVHKAREFLKGINN